MMDDVTLQINISPGDINYAHITVPALASRHPEIKNRLLVVDCCRPQKTKIVDPDIRFPKEKFERDVEKIIAISEQLLTKKIVDEVYYIRPDDPLLDVLSKKYLAGLYKTTHAAGGTGNMSYWMGFDLPKTRYVLHYDGDIMLYQKPGFDWAKEALKYMATQDDVVMSIPRFCPPVAGDYNLLSLHEWRPYSIHENYWKNDWFSTRHFLWDRKKVEKFLPFVRGKVKLELLLRKYGRRAFPLDPEIIMYKTLSTGGAKRLILKTDDAWMTHPVDKSADFLNNLNQILNCIESNRYPEEQRGQENMNLKAWLNYIKATG